MLFNRSSFFLNIVLLVLFIRKTDALCLLCENGASGVRTDKVIFLDDQGSTCASKSLQMASEFSEGGAMCRADINRYRNCCCNENAQCNSVEQRPTAPAVYNGPIGDFPVCDICKGGKVHNNAMVINMLYIGVGTCPQYYDYGMNGLIQPHLCDPLQHYAFEPCGCAAAGSNANNGGSSGNSPVFDIIDSVDQRKSPESVANEKGDEKMGGANGMGGAGNHNRQLKGHLKGSRA